LACIIRAAVPAGGPIARLKARQDARNETPKGRPWRQGTEIPLRSPVSVHRDQPLCAKRAMSRAFRARSALVRVRDGLAGWGGRIRTSASQNRNSPRLSARGSRTRTCASRIRYVRSRDVYLAASSVGFTDMPPSWTKPLQALSGVRFNRRALGPGWDYGSYDYGCGCGYPYYYLYGCYLLPALRAAALRTPILECKGSNPPAPTSQCRLSGACPAPRISATFRRATEMLASF
jgi:hypothetical protein